MRHLAMKPAAIRLGDLSVGYLHSLADAVDHLGHASQPLLEHYGLSLIHI